MKKIRTILAVLGLMVSFAAVPVQAQGVWDGCESSSASAVCADDTDGKEMIRRLVSVLLMFLGALAVILIIWSGFKFVTSRGDPANIKSAKDTLLYAVIGLVVAVFSYAIVNYVLSAASGR